MVVIEGKGDEEIRQLIDQLPKLNQRQYSTTAQLIQLVDLARKLGLYDAQDAINKTLLRHEDERF